MTTRVRAPCAEPKCINHWSHASDTRWRSNAPNPAFVGGRCARGCAEASPDGGGQDPGHFCAGSDLWGGHSCLDPLCGLGHRSGPFLCSLSGNTTYCRLYSPTRGGSAFHGAEALALDPASASGIGCVRRAPPAPTELEGEAAHRARYGMTSTANGPPSEALKLVSL